MASYCHSKLYCDHVIFDIDVRLMECLTVAAKAWPTCANTMERKLDTGRNWCRRHLNCQSHDMAARGGSLNGVCVCCRT